MADDIDEFDFGDDGTLDALAADELQALEEAAVKSTQQQWTQSRTFQQTRPHNPPSRTYNPQPQRYPQRNQQQQWQNPQRQQQQYVPPQQPLLQQPTPDYGAPQQPGQFQKSRAQTYNSYTSPRRDPRTPKTAQRATTVAYPQSNARTYGAQSTYNQGYNQTHNQNYNQTYNQTYVEEPTLPYTTIPTIPQPTNDPPAVPEKPPSDYGDFEFEEEAELLDIAAPTNVDQYQEPTQTLDDIHAPRIDVQRQNSHGGYVEANPATEAYNGEAWGAGVQGYEAEVQQQPQVMDYEQGAPVQAQDTAEMEELRNMVSQVISAKS